MKKIMSSVILILAASMFSTVNADAGFLTVNAGSGGLKGTVINIRTMQPMAGASVKLSGPAQESIVTGEDGNFEFSGLDSGTDYSLDISATDYQSQRFEDIVVMDDIITDLSKLVLWPEDAQSEGQSQFAIVYRLIEAQ